jgi:phage shock protein PspC (stress-responsive transcriptional regulator)
VCNGLGAYFGLDPTLFRIGFVLLTFLWGTGVLAYVLMVILVPHAKTSADKAAASGAAATTAQEFIKRAREGYYEGMRSFHDKEARRAWKRKFREDMRGWKRQMRGSSHYWHNWGQQWNQQWQQNWQQTPAQHPPVFGPVFIAPFLSILLFALVVLMVWAIYSIVTMHAVFGFALPATMPMWVGILLVVVAYQLVSWPIKSVRFACYYPAPHHLHGGLLGGLVGSLIGLFFLGFGIWMLDRHVPEFHEWMVQLPVLLHKFADTVQGWFATQG